MKKRWKRLFFGIIFCFYIPMIVRAQTYVYSIDSDYFTEEQLEELNTKAQTIYEETELEIFFFIREEESQDLISETETFYMEHAQEEYGMVLAVAGTEGYMYTTDAASEVFTVGQLDEMWDIYDSAPTYYDGVWEFYQYIEDEFSPYMEMESDQSEEESNDDVVQHPKRLVDDSNLLTSDESNRLLEQLDEISVRQQCDIVIVTVDSLEGKTATEYADDYFDYNGYGIGIESDGILLLVSMQERNWAISTCGSAIRVFTDAGQKTMTDQFVPKLSEGNYFGAFEQFAELCDEFLTQAKTGDPYDVHNLDSYDSDSYDSDVSEGTISIGIPTPVIAIGGGFLIAFLIVTMMKAKLKSVRSQAAASDYVRSGSLHITKSHDHFLYRHVSKKEKPKHTSSGGSSTHVSSSGRTHGGSSGSF